MTPPETLVQQIRELHTHLQQQVRSRWNRDLPLEELIFDRWERAQTLGFGEQASIYHNSYLYGHVEVGEHTWIGPYTLLDGSAGLKIGHYCSISTGVHIYTHDSVKWALSGGQADYEYAPVTIGDCCYIGGQTIITKGVTIGDHVVIGACSFVNKDVPPYTIAAGTPARAIGKVIQEGDQIRLVYTND